VGTGRACATGDKRAGLPPARGGMSRLGAERKHGLARHAIDERAVYGGSISVEILTYWLDEFELFE